MRSTLIGSAVLVFVSAIGWAQTPAQRQANTFHAPTPPSEQPRRFPELHPNRTVTFWIAAPGATDVTLQLQGSHPMTKEPGGSWSVTTEPLEPEVYSYYFTVDGARVLDTSNPFVKMGNNAVSLVDVPAVPPRFDQIQDVPHGSLQLLTYMSSPFKKQRNLYVYLPPEYATESSGKFPVLYLRHGDGDYEDGWAFQGRAGVILENLIAQRKAVPMIIVMPYGESVATGGGAPEGIDVLDKELHDDIIPLVDRRFRTLTRPESRAIAGLSMGGGQAFTIGLKHLEQFAWVGEFSSGLVSDVDFRLEKSFPSVVADAVNVNKRLKLLFLSCGTEDPRYPGHLDLIDSLKLNNIHHVWYSTPGGHEWKVWRHSLNEFLPRLFRS